MDYCILCNKAIPLRRSPRKDWLHVKSDLAMEGVFYHRSCLTDHAKSVELPIRRLDLTRFNVKKNGTFITSIAGISEAEKKTNDPSAPVVTVRTPVKRGKFMHGRILPFEEEKVEEEPMKRKTRVELPKLAWKNGNKGGIKPLGLDAGVVKQEAKGKEAAKTENDLLKAFGIKKTAMVVLTKIEVPPPPPVRISGKKKKNPEVLMTRNIDFDVESELENTDSYASSSLQSSPEEKSGRRLTPEEAWPQAFGKTVKKKPDGDLFYEKLLRGQRPSLGDLGVPCYRT